MSQTKFDSQEPFDVTQGRHYRRSIRLKGFDYSQVGAYFVTIVAFQCECLFGEIVDGEMRLNHYGEIVQKRWDDIPIHFPNVEAWTFVVMSNHVHGIIVITNRRGTVPVPDDNRTNNFKNQKRGEMTSPCKTGGETPPLHAPTLGQIIAYFKYQSTKEMNALCGDTITKFWQRNYYEHIICNEREMDNIWRYIEANPSRWNGDDENPRRGQP